MPSWPDLPEPVDGPGRQWAELLDGFERELALVDDLAGGVETQDAGWAPPVAIGPLPASERARALTILEAQRAAMRRLEGLRAELARHIDATKAATARPSDAAAYLDRIA